MSLRLHALILGLIMIALLLGVLTLTPLPGRAMALPPPTATARPTIVSRAGMPPAGPTATGRLEPTLLPATPTHSPSPTLLIEATMTVRPDIPDEATPDDLRTIPRQSPLRDLTLNEVPLSQIVVMPPVVLDHTRTIFARGRTLNRNAFAFSKLGDSLIATPEFLTRFDSGGYELGGYNYLQPAIDHFDGSFARYGVAIHVGLHAWGIFNPTWADKEWCQPNEDMLACEIRLYNPSVLLILVGSNDNGAAEAFNENMRRTVEFCLNNGIIPVLATKADRFEGLDNRNNLIVRQIAVDYAVPLWDFDVLAATLPGRGLKVDQIHLNSLVVHDYSRPETMTYGHPVHNLTALMMLDEIRRNVILPELNITP